MTHNVSSRPAFAPPAPDSVPIWVATPDTIAAILTQLPQPAATWARAQGASGKPGEVIALPDASGALAGALLGAGPDDGRTRFATAGAASRLPAGSYRLAHDPGDAAQFALGWLLDSYRFARYASQPAAAARLVCPEGVDGVALLRIASSEYLARDLINTPAADMGPDGIEAAARALADSYGAQINATKGDDLLRANLPLIHAVGRAGERAPRLIDLSWGSGPLLTLVGKGVAFDTGGLNLKPAGSMGLMKKDMGGAANVLALARAIMDADWPLRLRVLIPAVENNVAANAYRPGDILTARNGLTVEVNNTDAEGRLVLADALALGAETAPERIVSMATLTGAARVAVGPDIAPFFSTDEPLAQALAQAAAQVSDPVWRLPFHAPYERLIEPGIADLDNAPGGGMAGAITAALFLRRFTNGCAYTHFDVYGWTPTAAPARPRGGAGQGWRSLFAALPGLIR